MGMVNVPARDHSMCNGPVAPKSVIHEWGRKRSLVGPREKGREWHRMSLQGEAGVKVYRIHKSFPRERT